MAIRSGFFNAIEGDRTYDASRFAEYFNALVGNGIFPEPTNNLQVVSNNDMTVTVKAGKAWINGYIVINDSDYILNIDAADGVLNRVDRVVARYDVIDREIRLEVKKGEFASEAIAPAIQRDSDAHELGLALINISAGTGSILTANVTDTRLDEDVCGIVSSLLKNEFTVEEKEKLANIENEANKYIHPLSHSLDIITETSLRKIFSSTERTKLAGIETSANNYTHPSTHSLDMITETTVKKIMTSTERTKLAGIASGAQVNTVTSVAGKTGAVSVTKSDVGLSAVLNYGVATTAEAQAGISNTKYMTPLRVKEAVDANVKVAHGTYTGNGTTNRIITVGFQPKQVIILYTNNNYGDACLLTSNASKMLGEVGTNYISQESPMTSTGFIIKFSSFNNSSGIYDWTAIG